jgi:CDP-glucose 4,6-dehydratase
VVNHKDLTTLVNAGPILITGVTGFKGSWLALILKELGAEVHGMGLSALQGSLFESAKIDKFLDTTIIDITCHSNLRKYLKDLKPAVIFHLAAQSLVLDSYKDPLRTFEINSLGTANLLDISLEIDSLQYIGVATTDKVYNQGDLARRFVEDDYLFGNDPYSMSKVSCEIVCASWHNLSRSIEGPTINTYRAGNVIGGGDLSENRLIPDLVRSFQNKTNLILRNPESTRPWSHVTSILFGYLYAASLGVLQKSANLQNGRKMNSYNFGPTELSLNCKSVVEIFNSNLNQDHKIEVKNMSNADYENILQEAKFLDLDSSKAHRVLGWVPYYDQVSSIKKTFGWWKEVIIEGVDPLDACLNDISLARAFYSDF